MVSWKMYINDSKYLDHQSRPTLSSSYDYIVFSVLVIDEAELAMAIQTDAKNIDRLAERLYCRDYSRLGLGTLTGTHRMRSEGFRVTMVNTTYQLCRR